MLSRLAFKSLLLGPLSLLLLRLAFSNINLAFASSVLLRSLLATKHKFWTIFIAEGILTPLSHSSFLAEFLLILAFLLGITK